MNAGLRVNDHETDMSVSISRWMRLDTLLCCITDGFK